MTLKIKKLRQSAKTPIRATDGAAGYDLSACIESELLLPAGGCQLIPTGIAIALPENTVGLVFGRSGLGIRHQIAPANAVGVIDSDYRGEISVGLLNTSDADFTVGDGDRIAQLMFMPVLQANLIVSDELSDTSRGAGGFGSTGIK